MKKLVIGIMLLFALFVHSEEFELLTKEQAKQYIINSWPDGIINDIIKLDYIEHMTLDIQMPSISLIREGPDIIVKYSNTGIAKLGPLEYSIIIPEVRFSSFIDPPNNILSNMLWLSGGLIAGVGITILIINTVK
jgi:hypothetical protein